ncbi:transglycosylase SLT domain-containing protein [Mesorhizobium yinganensis]|uniref:transglycosylase SLT domain-containing protein n=1 Tax=Mesorhizobium yinganensis TaxID=3157707 RepID=UPI0032B7BE90
MRVASFSKSVPIAGLLALSACATPPKSINNICAVFEQRDGWFDNWQRSANATEAKYGIPVHVLMATVRKESGFKGNARPKRTKLFGFIPWTRVSSAYGYSQALNGTWSQYQRETGNFTARRTKFADAVDFVGWYHSKTVSGYGVSPDDTYRLYLAYYHGWGGFKRGNWTPEIKKYARDTDDMARRYQAQLRSCGG